MGVGKTVQAICIMYLFKEDWPLMILCPSSLKFTWREEILKWLPEMRPEHIQLFKQGKDKFNDNAKVYIMSYDLAARRFEEISARNFKASIADESHYLKNRDAKRSKNLIPILMNSKRCILISGTPILSRPVELYNILRILRPDIFHNFNDYANRYCDPSPGKFGVDYNGKSCTSELHFLLSRNLMIRRLKADVLSELPDKRRQKIQIPVDPKMQKEIMSLLNDTDEG